MLSFCGAFSGLVDWMSSACRGVRWRDDGGIRVEKVVGGFVDTLWLK